LRMASATVRPANEPGVQVVTVRVPGDVRGIENACREGLPVVVHLLEADQFALTLAFETITRASEKGARVEQVAAGVVLVVPRIAE
jgi:hypothetical protein